MMTYAQATHTHRSETNEEVLENGGNFTNTSTQPSSILPPGLAWNPPQAPKAYRTNNGLMVSHGTPNTPNGVSKAPEQHTKMFQAHRPYPVVRRDEARQLQNYALTAESPASPSDPVIPKGTASTFELGRVYGLDASPQPVHKDHPFQDYDSGPEETGTKMDDQEWRHSFSQRNENNLELASCQHDEFKARSEIEKHSYTVEFGPACQLSTVWVHAYNFERISLTFGSLPPLELWKIKAQPS